MSSLPLATSDQTPIMPIRPYLDGHKFDPETIRVMGLAFENDTGGFASPIGTNSRQ